MQVYHATSKLVTLEEMEQEFKKEVQQAAGDKRFITRNKLTEIGWKYVFSLRVNKDDPDMIYNWINTFLTEAGNTYILTDLS